MNDDGNDDGDDDEDDTLIHWFTYMSNMTKKNQMRFPYSKLSNLQKTKAHYSLVIEFLGFFKKYKCSP